MFGHITKENARKLEIVVGGQLSLVNNHNIFFGSSCFCLRRFKKEDYSNKMMSFVGRMSDDSAVVAVHHDVVFEGRE